MNTLKGQIVDLKVDGTLTLVHTQVGSLTLTAIVIDTPTTVEYLQVGHEVDVIFKETEVVIALPGVEGVSLQNQLPGTVTKLHEGSLLTKLEIETAVGPITSVVTTHAVESLGVKEGAELVAMVKTNEVMLSPR